MLSLFFRSPEIFTEDFIIDELMDFFLAATATTQNASQTLVGHFATDRDSLSKVRQEFEEVSRQSERFDPADQDLDKLDFLRKFATYENVLMMTHLGYIIQEVLRFMNPVPHSTVSSLSQDATIGKYQFKAGDVIQVNITGLHMNKSQWQKPHEFRPERFDSSHPLSLAPDGSKRKTMAFCPFLAGKRVCFGKTFAESVIRVMAVYMGESFDMRFKEEEKYPDTHSLPLV